MAQTNRISFIGSDTLSTIVSFLNGYDISMLWLTGDVIMRKLLAQNGVVQRFETNFETALFPLKIAFPELVSRFPGVKTLHLSDQRSLDDIDQEIRYEGLPSTLEELHLYRIALTPLVALLELGVHRFSHLTSLKAVDREYLWQSKSLQVLPTSLETLEIGIIESLSLIDQTILPPHLTSLSITTLPGTVLDPLPNPPKLYKLRLTMIAGFEVWRANVRSFMASLPRTLEHLALTGALGLKQSLEALPSSLKHLELETVFLDDFTAWKTTLPLLTYLNLRHPHPMSAEIFSLLPSGITSAHLSPIDVVFNISTLAFPAGLMHWNESNWIGNRMDEVAPLLPQTLRTLTVLGTKLCSMATIQVLPKSLTLMHFRTLTSEMVDALPPNLTALKVSQCQSLKDKDILRLPTSIRFLELDNSFKVRFGTICSRFPLTHLAKSRMSGSNVPFKYELFQSICPTLTELILEDVRFETATHDESFWKSLIYAPQLRSIRLKGVTKQISSTSPIESDMSHLDPDIIYSLPRSIRDVHLENMRGPITDSHMISLPKLIAHLTLLEPTSCDITDESIPHWPQHFISIQLPPSKLISKAGANHFCPQRQHRVTLGRVALSALRNPSK